MTTPRFLQIHTLQSYPAALLNRDDSGLAKRLPLGGATRTRISSQCRKRHWRMAEDEFALRTIGVPMAVRSRHIVDRGILGALIEDGVERSIAEAIAEVFLKALFQESAKRSKASKKDKDKTTESEFDARTGQAVLFGEPELNLLRDAARAIAKDAASEKIARERAEAYFKDRDVRANLAAMKHHAGLEAALFGRMVTSDLIANTDAAIHVAHAFTVHAEESESDYFTVVDDLRGRTQGDDAGSAGIFDMELTSGLYYGYVVVDVPKLVSNLEGCATDKCFSADTDRNLAATVVEHLCHLIAKVSPGAKLGATAPYAWAELTLIEAGTRQPRTLANAFREPVALRPGQLLQLSIEQLREHLDKLDRAYGVKEVRRVTSLEPAALPAAESVSFDALAAWAAGAVRDGRA